MRASVTPTGVPDNINTSTPTPSTGRGGNNAQRGSGGAAYASAAQLASLGDYIRGLTQLTRETGWHTPTTVITCDDTVEDESVVIGIRWVGDAYFAEIR